MDNWNTLLSITLSILLVRLLTLSCHRSTSPVPCPSHCPPLPAPLDLGAERRGEEPGNAGGGTRGRGAAGARALAPGRVPLQPGSPLPPPPPARRPPPRPPSPGKARALGERRCSVAGSRAERSAWRPPGHPPTLGGRPCPPRPGPAALPSAVLRRPARRGRGRGRGRAGEAGPGRRAAAGMRGWRRNLALCLQRLPDEGRTRPLPTPVSTGAARGTEGGPSAKLAGRGGAPAEGLRRRRRAGGRVRGAELAGSPQDTRCGAEPGRGNLLGRSAGRAEVGPGAGRPLEAGAQTLNPRGRSPGPTRRVRFPERALAGAATTCLPALGEFAGVGMCGVLSAGDTSDPIAAVAGTQLSFTRPAGPPRRPHGLQFVKVAERREAGRVRGLGVDLAALTTTPVPVPAPAWPCRSAAAQPPPPGRSPLRRGASGAAPTLYLLSEPRWWREEEGPAPRPWHC
ncbi:uncharacterized protein LOC111144311 [Enhydra lutris kenyoni]|uniref:Uncharacterized protein LOC111144311 n=1 Tax=Enhydra lutris kenyoni TaxID=391180 RepID=A0A2Y9J3G3_ENHLU|nr:uncharacterized protein LOC111144311 [Enhydra lutris kenyoni]